MEYVRNQVKNRHLNKEMRLKYLDLIEEESLYYRKDLNRMKN